MNYITLFLKNIIRKEAKATFLIIILLAVILAAYNAVSLSVNSLNVTVENNQKDIYGSQSAIALNIPKEIGATTEIKKFGYFTVFGTMPLKQESFKAPIALGTADDNAKELNRIKLLEGNFPENENQIAIEEWVFAVLNIPTETQQDIKLKYSFLTEEGTLEETEQVFKVTGIIKNYANIQVNQPKTQAMVDQLPNILFFKPQNNTITHMSFELASSQDINSAIGEISRDYFPTSNIIINHKIIDINTQSSDNAMNSGIMNALLIVVICAGGVLLVLFFNLYTQRDKTRLTILKNIGATNKNIFNLLFCNNLFAIIVSIPVGLILGVLLFFALKGVFLQIFDIALVTVIDLNVMLISVLIYFIICIIGALVISHLTTRLKKKKAAKLEHIQIRTKSPYILLSYKSALSNSNKLISSVLSLAICVVIITVGAILSASINENSYTINCDYRITYGTRTGAGPLRIPVNKIEGFTLDELKPVMIDNSIQSYILTKNIDMNFYKAENNLLDEIFEGRLIMPLWPGDDATELFNSEKAKYKYGDDLTLYRSQIIGLEDEALNDLQNYTVIGNIDINKLKNAENIILFVPENQYNEKFNELIGSEIVLTQVINWDSESNVGTRIDLPTVISAILVMPPNKGSMTELFGDGIDFILPQSALDKIDTDILYNGLYLQLFDSKVTGNLDVSLAQLNIDTDAYIVSNTQLNSEIKKLNNLVSFVSSSIILLISCITLFNMLMQYLYKLNQQKAAIKRLHTIGMTFPKLNILLIFDYVFFLGFAYLIAIPVSAVFAYLAYSSVQILDIGLIVVRNLWFLLVLIVLGIILYLYNAKWLKTNIKN